MERTYSKQPMDSTQMHRFQNKIKLIFSSITITVTWNYTLLKGSFQPESVTMGNILIYVPSNTSFSGLTFLQSRDW